MQRDDLGRVNQCKKVMDKKKGKKRKLSILYSGDQQLT